MLHKTIATTFATLALTFASYSVTAQQTVVGTIPAEFSVSGGAASYSIPISVAPGRGGMQPELSLNYSGGGNGILGVGWSLSGTSSIHRCPATHAQDGFSSGINFDNKDRYCLDGQRLVPINGINANGGVGTEYKTEIDGYSQIKSYGGPVNNPSYWIVKTKAGQVMTYGGSGNATNSIPQGPLNWSIRTINDTTGNNSITFDYFIDQHTQYLDDITYTGGRVELVYENGRPDQIERYMLGNTVVAAKRVKKVLTYHSGALLQEYKPEYLNTDNQYSKIKSISVCGADGTCVQPTEFTWQQNSTTPNFVINNSVSLPVHPNNTPEINSDLSRISYNDFNGDGFLDIYRINGDGSTEADTIHLGSASGQFTQTNGPVTHVGDDRATSRDISRIKFGDFNGDGYVDVYRVEGWGSSAADTVYLNGPNGFTGTTMAGAPTYISASVNESPIDIGRVTLVDMNGDGLTDVYRFNGNGSTQNDTVYINNGDGTYATWNNGPATSMSSVLAHKSIDLTRMHFNDFNGDGLIDVYRTEGWSNSPEKDSIYLNDGAGNFSRIDGPATKVHGSQRGARPDVARIRFGDFNSDGLTDVYRINGTGSGNDNLDTIYLSKGDGTYAIRDGINTAIENGIDNSTRDIARIKIVDFDGDGRSDIYVVKGNHNQSVNDEIHLTRNTGYQTLVGPSTVVGCCTTRAEADMGRISFGDFDGNGSVDIYRADSSSSPDRIFSSAMLTQMHLTDITDSYGNYTQLEYKPLTDASVYTKGTGAQYPVQDVISPQYVIHRVMSDDGIGGSTTVEYQ